MSPFYITLGVLVALVIFLTIMEFADAKEYRDKQKEQEMADWEMKTGWADTERQIIIDYLRYLAASPAYVRELLRAASLIEAKAHLRWHEQVKADIRPQENADAQEPPPSPAQASEDR